MRVLIGTLVALILSVALNGYLFYSLQPGGLAIAGADTDCSASAGVVNFIGYSDALDGQSYEGFEVGGLSGLTSPPSQDHYYSLPDNGSKDSYAHFYTLSLPLDQTRLADPAITAVTVLYDQQGKPYTEANFDGESIDVTATGDFLIVSEIEPSIRRFSPDGYFLSELSVPQKFLLPPEGGAQHNSSLESLSLSPDESSLFTINQEPLALDGQENLDKRKRLRLLRYEAQGSSEYDPSQEYFYLAEHNNSVSDIVALSDTELLILESGERQIYRVSLNGDEDDVSAEESLADSSARPLEKELLVDVDDECPLPSVKGTHSFGLLEDITLGPQLSNGRQALLLQSDDDFRDISKTRIIALSIQL